MNFNLFHPAKSVTQLGYGISQIGDALMTRGLFIRRFNHVDFNLFPEIVRNEPDQAVPKLLLKIGALLNNNEF